MGEALPRARRSRPPRALLAVGLAIGAATALPVAYLAITVGDSLDQAVDTLWRERTLRLVLRSVGLAGAVTVLAVALALPLAWLTARTDLPGRRAWTVLTLLPLVIPSYIGAYLIVSALGPRGLVQDLLAGPFGVERLPSIYGFPGALLTLVLFTYPLALITIRAAMSRLDPQLEEAARGMGRSGWQTYRSVVLPQLVPAIGASGLLVALYVLHDFGAVSILRFDSFTRVIYTAYGTGSRTSAAALASLLVLVMLAVLWLEGRARGRLAYHRSAPGTARPPATVALGPWRWPALAFCSAVVLLALALPVGVLVYWSLQSVAGSPDWAAIGAGAGNSLIAAGMAAAVAALCALPVALLSVRFPGMASGLAERASYAGYALPGVVVALALVFFGTRVVPVLYQSLAMLVFAWVVLFLPQAIGSTRASLLQVSPRVEEAARAMGRSPLDVLRTVTTPLAASGVMAGAALVFLTAVKELPAALILAPIGFETLSTEIWGATSVGFFERGAVPSLVLLLVSAPPLYLLTARGR
ncbi:MAG TPA: iron ABC transporter permease [Thermoleophilaceae bacterium]|nr:iron ABC transporter permease [Thermoleophilaceae bacterium]